MSVMIESTEELLTILKKMNLKVTNVDELRQLLASINADYNPDAARQKTGRQIGTIVPGAMAGAAAFASFFLLASGHPTVEHMPFVLGGLAVVWVSVAVVSTAAVIAGAVLSSSRRGRAMPENPPDQLASRMAVVTNFIKELPT